MMSFRKVRVFTNPTMLGSALLLGLNSSAIAAPQLEEVIVTAQKRSENLQDVPVAVSAITADQLDDIGFNDIADIAAQVPSLIVLTNISPLSATFRIRNIGNAGNIPTFEPATGLFIDGAFRSRSGMGIGDLADVQSVEVLKGPQSTLHGKNVTAGVISVTTKAPSDTLEGMVEASLGDDQLQQLKTSISGPLTDWLSGRVSWVETHRDAWINNTIGADSDNQDSRAIRGQLQADFSDQLSARLIVGYSEKDLNPMSGDVYLSEAAKTIIANAGGKTSIANDPTDRKVEYRDNTTFASESNDVILKVEYALDKLSFTSISSYDDYESANGVNDVEQQSLQVADFLDVQNGHSFSQELRFASNDNARLNWLAGLFYYENTFIRGDRDRPEFIAQQDIAAYGDAVADYQISLGILPINLLPLTIPALGVAGDRGDYYVKQQTESVGIFNKYDLSLSEQWQMSLGLRYSYEKKYGRIEQSNQLSVLGCVPPLNTNLLCSVTPDGSNYDGTLDFEAITGAFSSSYFLTADSMIYGSLSTGFKAGGFSLQNGTAADESRPYGEENVTNYEIGLKSEFLDKRARINAAAFYTEYEDFQNASYAGLIFVVNNAELVTVSGVEIDSTFILTPSLIANINVAYIDTIYDKYTGGQCYYGRAPDNDLGQCDLSGENLPSATRIKGNIALNYYRTMLSGEFYTRLDYLYNGDANNSASLDPRAETSSYGITNLRLGWQNSQWDLALWGKNLSDKNAVAQTAPANIHTQADRNVGAAEGSYQAFTIPPRSIGLTARRYF
ncbi:TonB-dependent receptor [Zhongshania marina]|uniref:TonB-dependent receptor n=1 Tax=Zhongshania marina TaxID=2304603 RepID=A0ABX9W1J2_9GAMM|nr:hypothetical protein D0911_10880 [Zhongshania marina]